MIDVTIRPASSVDTPAVAAFCQPIYAAVYPNDKYGLKPEHFSAEIFQTPDTLAYFSSILTNSDTQRAYIAEQGGSIVGTISIERLDGFYEIHAFYVAVELQGQGIGRRLMSGALTFCADRLPVLVEVAETSASAISLYKHWGFRPAPQLGIHLRHWPEWPEGLKNGYIFLQANQGDIHV